MNPRNAAISVERVREIASMTLRTAAHAAQSYAIMCRSTRRSKRWLSCGAPWRSQVQAQVSARNPSLPTTGRGA